MARRPKPVFLFLLLGLVLMIAGQLVPGGWPVSIAGVVVLAVFWAVLLGCAGPKSR